MSSSSSPVPDFESLNSCWWALQCVWSSCVAKLHDDGALCRASDQKGQRVVIHPLNKFGKTGVMIDVCRVLWVFTNSSKVLLAVKQSPLTPLTASQTGHVVQIHASHLPLQNDSNLQSKWLDLTHCHPWQVTCQSFYVIAHNMKFQMRHNEIFSVQLR